VTPPSVLVLDIGGSHVKMLATGRTERREFESGPKMTPDEMVRGVLKAAKDWKYDVIAMGYPGPVFRGRPVSEPHNLAPGWVEFDYAAALGRPVKIINDAAMQALGSYRESGEGKGGGGKMLFRGLGTGLGSAMVVHGIVEAMELGHLPYKKHTYEHYVGDRALKKHGKKKWRREVAEVVAALIAALEPNDVVLGGGNIHHLKTLPKGCRAGDNANAFKGGFRMWDDDRTTGGAGRSAFPIFEKARLRKGAAKRKRRK
jgi:polyphosphate glucokinase